MSGCCDRREFMRRVARTGLALSVFGLTAERGQLLRQAQAIEPRDALYDAALLVFFDGGPSQTDTWDPKPGSPNNVFGTISLGVNDVYGQPVRISDVFPTLAAKVQGDPAVGLGLVRSMTHGNGAHEPAQRYMNCFWEGAAADLYPSTAAVMAHYQKGRSAIGIPAVVVDGANGLDANTAKLSRVPTALRVAAGDGQNPVVRSLQLPPQVDADRYRRRSLLTERLNQRFLSRRNDTAARTFADAAREAAAITLQGDAARAFDLTGVPLVSARDTGTARRLTQAARLLEFGVPYVACGIGGNDSHENNMATIQGNWGQSVDLGVTQLVERVQATGKRVLILLGGEFGRTPDSVQSGRDGRDHWTDGFSWAMVSVNQPRFRTTAIGDTGPNGMFRASDNTLVDPIRPKDLGAFVYKSLGFQVGDPAFHVPLLDRDASPVDRVNDGDRLLQTFLPPAAPPPPPLPPVRREAQ